MCQSSGRNGAGICLSKVLLAQAKSGAHLLLTFWYIQSQSPRHFLLHGEYWHTGKYAAETALKEAMINAACVALGGYSGYLGDVSAKCRRCNG
jgi:hypothetical protein